MSIIDKVGFSEEERRFMIWPGSTINYEKVMNLSDEEFMQLHLELMREYRDKDGWWGPGREHHCDVCHNLIVGPEELARYHGATMHQSPCFGKFWEKERNNPKCVEGPFMKKYWDRIAQMKIQSHKFLKT